MHYNVFLTASAESDLEEIHHYILNHDSKTHADAVLNQLTKVVETLCSTPERGAYPKELRSLGMHDYRQIFFKPYRVMYRIVEKEKCVFIVLIADGRRNMQSLLEYRLLSH